MGATGVHLPRGEKAFDVFTSDLSPKHSVVAHGTKRAPYSGWQYATYMALRHEDTNEVIALVVLWTRTPRGYWNLTYKFVDETMGPNEHSAPRKVLEALTPTDSEYANEWRKRAWENLAKEAQKPTVTAGTTIRFAAPLNFGAHGQYDTFTKMATGPTHFRTDTGLPVRIPNWKHRDYARVV